LSQNGVWKDAEKRRGAESEISLLAVRFRHAVAPAGKSGPGVGEGGGYVAGGEWKRHWAAWGMIVVEGFRGC